MNKLISDEQLKEQQRVDHIIEQIDQQIEATKIELKKAHEETQRVQKNFNMNTSVNYIEADDRIETKAELQQQRSVVSRDLENEAIIKRHLKTLRRLKASPYFGRIDVQRNGQDQIETMYIGTASFSDENQHFLIYDWRAPISSVYYNGTLGPVSYQTPEGKTTVILKRKRQFNIQDGQIINMFDTNETVGDEMLQQVLGNQNDEKMHNIVSTIQHEQNDIIRDTTSDLLVVQGVAGSGKTSAILQRIAFLLYHSRSSLQADQMVLFSPNRLFSNYISNVLPSLGERNMRQVTMAEFIAHRFEGLKVQTLFDQYENEEKLSDAQRALKQYKGSAKIMEQMTDYVQAINGEQITFTPIMFNGKEFFTAQEIKNIYDRFPIAMSVAQRILKTKNQLIIRLKHRIKSEAHQPWADDAVDLLSNEEINQMLSRHQLEDFQEEDDERRFLAYRIAKKRLRIVYDAIYNNQFWDAYLQYRAFLNKCDFDDQAAWQNSIDKFDRSIEQHELPLDDAAPLLYMRELVIGGGTNRSMQYLFIDEMQDYSLAELIYLKHAFPNAKFNLIGDSEQALFKAVQAPQTLLNELNQTLHSHRARLITLNRSYRSTYQITTFAKSLLPDGEQIEAFNRQGDVPKLIISKNLNESLNQVLINAKSEMKDRQNRNVAIITKNHQEAHLLYRYLNQKCDVTLMNDQDLSIPSGIIILPIYLAKGLEFDTVIAWDVSQDNYSSTNLTGTLYTIATRAMHHLILTSINQPSELISNKSVEHHLIKINYELNTNRTD